MSLDQADNSSLAESPFQPFESLPDEVLLLLLDQLTPFQRCLILSICKKWNHTILQRKSWWQYLDIPDHLPFSTALSILQTFNPRSNFTLKHVTIQTLMETSEEVDEVFVQLEKSSSHVKLLFLNQSRSMTKARRAAQTSLPHLNTFFLAHNRSIEQWAMSMWRARGDMKVQDEGQKGLQLLHVRALEQLEADDLEWFSKLKLFSCGGTCSLKDLRAILEAAKTTLKKLKLDSWKFKEDLEELDSIRTDGCKRIDFPNLEEVYTPNFEASAAALGSLIDVGGQERATLFFGSIQSLLYFDFPSLVRVRLRMYDRSALKQLELDEEESKAKTTLFFERNPSISQLILDWELPDGQNFHFNFIMHSLSTAKTSSKSHESGRESQTLLLPKLQSLSISKRQALNKKLLKQFWETRKVIQEDFKIQVYAEGKAFSIDRSGGEEWLDEANCE